jgi:hypothetical protein
VSAAFAVLSRAQKLRFVGLPVKGRSQGVERKIATGFFQQPFENYRGEHGTIF